ncbi:MAG: protein TolQ [Rhodospirillaceae bacterium]|nr:protein TolQ [Rhodospirillaceae bacterium]|tara:strand:- start:183 stop:908 length:726 start_codon:yes stop_codon:yes gene_type:complete
MEGDVVNQVVLGGAGGDLSVWALIEQADIIVKIVMAILILASIWCWAIIFEKSMRLRRLKNEAERFEESFWSGGALDDLYDRIGSRPSHPMELIFSVAMREWNLATSRGRSPREEDGRTGLQQRIDRVMRVAMNREIETIEKHMGFLATVGSTAPFVGLFGTVWGIMNSFQSIALTKNTSLAVVAPGIAEALLATALGLIAAIPAVVAYNKLTNDLSRYASRLEIFADEFSTLMSRQLSER